MSLPSTAGPQPENEVSEPEQASSGSDISMETRRFLWRGKIGPAFWTVASIFSLAVNIILIVIILVLARQLFSIKSLVADQLIGGLYNNFQQMDNAHIITTIQVQDTIQVKDTIPVVFDLPLKQNTEVILTKNTPVKNTTIFLNGVAVPVDLVLKKGTTLNIGLDLTVPVSQTVPVNLTVPVRLKVPVDIALNQTDLHRPFVGLQGVVAPYLALLIGLPNSWEETPLCKPESGFLCQWLAGTK